MNPSTYSDDDLREKLRYHEGRIAYANATCGVGYHTRSQRAMLDEVYIGAHPWQQEAKKRGITSSKLYDALLKMSDVSLKTLLRALPKRTMISDPSQVTALQRVALRRGLIDE